MPIGITAEHEELGTVMRRFVEANAPSTVVRTVVEFDRAGHFAAEYRVLRFAQSEADAQQIRAARHQMPGATIQTCRMHAEEHFVVGDQRPG